MLKIYLNQQLWSDLTELYLVDSREDGTIYAARPMELVFEKKEIGTLSEPTLKMSGIVARDFLPALSQALSDSGYRPKTDDGKQIDALKYHLEDMRKLVFK